MVSCISPLIKDRFFDSSQINVKDTKKIIGIAKRIAASVVFFLLNSVAPIMTTSAITIYKGKEFEEWNGHALITSLKDKSLRKLIFNDLSNVKEEIIFSNKIGRIRDIQVHPNNGKIYFLAENNFWLMEKN